MKKRPSDTDIGSKGEALLRVIVASIWSDRTQERQPDTLIPYSEALQLLGTRMIGGLKSDGSNPSVVCLPSAYDHTRIC